MVDVAMKKFLNAWLIYESAKELHEEAKKANSVEQLTYIEPLFAKAFPELSTKGITYSDSWQCDDEQDAIKAWEIAKGIDEFCSDVATRVSHLIDELKQKEREAEKNALNAALDMFEADVNTSTLSNEEKLRFRETVNAEGYSREKSKFIEYLQKFVDGAKK